MVSRRKREDIGRRSASRTRRKRFLLVCEGIVTEREYFYAFAHQLRHPMVHVEISKEQGVPLTVVKKAIELRALAEVEAKTERDDNLRYDSVWAVIDVDEHPKPEETLSLAAANGIRVARSNPCFELWAFLHFGDQRAHIERGKLASALRKHLPGYEKRLPYEKLKEQYPVALARARKLDAEASRLSSPGRNPTTGVHVLTEEIRAEPVFR